MLSNVFGTRFRRRLIRRENSTSERRRLIGSYLTLLLIFWLQILSYEREEHVFQEDDRFY